MDYPWGIGEQPPRAKQRVKCSICGAYYAPAIASVMLHKAVRFGGGETCCQTCWQQLDSKSQHTIKTLIDDYDRQLL